MAAPAAPHTVAPAPTAPAPTAPAPAPTVSGRLTTLVCDEFAALLDRVTACIVARCLRRAIDRSNGRACAIVATSHDDLVRALLPDIVVNCDFFQVTVEKSTW
jgi:ABC-type ATPase with predicted acetyltransferase domain